MGFMGLMNDYVEDCTLLEKRRVPDGEGGWFPTWVDGMTFQATIVNDTTIEARVAELQGMTATYTVSTDKSMPLDYNDVFRRESDGKTFRVKSNSSDKHTPNSASFQFCQATAEEWEITT